MVGDLKSSNSNLRSLKGRNSLRKPFSWSEENCFLLLICRSRPIGTGLCAATHRVGHHPLSLSSGKNAIQDNRNREREDRPCVARTANSHEAGRRGRTIQTGAGPG